jgi:predicted transcriptional regulator
MRVEDLMSAPVMITRRNVKIEYLKDMFTRKGPGAVPVLEEGGAIAGIVSASDVVKCHNESLTVQDIMTDRVHIVLKNNRVKDAARIMSKNDVHHLVVMEDGNVVGILSALDIVKVYREE